MFVMITFLRKLFIKDYKNTLDPKVREKHGVLAALGGIVVNLLLFTFKLLIGLLTFSMSIISDAINNLTDLFSCFVSLFGFKIANKPADKKHPYGHQRVEYIAGMIVSFVIIVIALILGYSSISLLIESDANRIDFSNATWMFVILGGSILFKLFLAFFYHGLGKAINSVALKANKQDSINDIICTTAVLIASIIQFYIPSIWWLDLAMSLGVSVFILYSGIKMVIETASPLIGLTPDEDLVKNVLEGIKSYRGVLGVHDLAIHSYGPNKTFVTIHVEVDGYSNMFEAHDLVDKIEEEIASKYGVEITIHMDPIDTKNKELPILKQQITSILNEIDSSYTFHDLRLIVNKDNTTVLFDLVVGEDKHLNLKTLNRKITKRVNGLDKKYRCSIRIDQNYLS